jgi:hypothetical protein
MLWLCCVGSVPNVDHQSYRSRRLFSSSRFFSFTQTPQEISILADEDTIIQDFLSIESPGTWLQIAEEPFRALQIDSELGWGV